MRAVEDMPASRKNGTGSAASVRARRGKRHTVRHAGDAVGFKPRIAVCVLPDAAGMPPNLFFA